MYYAMQKSKYYSFYILKKGKKKKGKDVQI